MNRISLDRWAKDRMRRLLPAYRFSSDLFEELLLDHLNYRVHWLDAGCGENLLVAEHGRRAKFALGIDGKGGDIRGDLEALPLRDNSVDVVSCKWVVEHLRSPAVVMAEFKRVLKPGGRVLIQTTNRWHYLIILGRVMPRLLKRLLIHLVYGAREDDVWPTFYRWNTRARFVRDLPNMGFVLLRFYANEELHRFSKVAFWLSYLYLRFTDRESLRDLRSSFVVLYAKQRGLREA